MPTLRIRHGSIGLGLLLSSGCLLVVPFEYGGEGPGVGGSGAGDGGQPAAGAGSGAGGAGGEGGSDRCAGLDFATNSENCGECKFSCGGGECVDGRCAAATDVAGGPLRSVLVVGDYVYFSQQAGNGEPARIQVLPTDFVKDEAPGLGQVVENEVATFASGPTGEKHVYYIAQGSTILRACDLRECTPVDLGTSVTNTGYVMAATADRLYFGDVIGTRVLSMVIGADGVPLTGDPPGSEVTVEVASHASPFANSGVSEVRFQPPDRLIWASQSTGTDVNGCIYTAQIGDLEASPPMTDVPCWSARFATAGFAVSAAGDVYAQDGWFLSDGPAYQVHRFAAGSAAETAAFAIEADAPRAIDDQWLYAKHTMSAAIRLHPLDGGAPVAAFTAKDPPSALIMGLDVSHPDYVFYTDGNTLHRWLKPRR